MYRRFLFVAILLSFLFTPKLSLAQDSTPTPTPTPVNQSEIDQINQQITQYQQKLSELGKSKNTLANQIQILDSQVQLTLLNIRQTQAQISQLDKDIISLTDKIGQLDISLTQLSNLYLNQVTQNYKLQKRVPPLSAFLSSINFNYFLEQYKYLSVLQADSQNTLISMETTRTTADQEKDLKQTKQSEMQTLQKKLSAQQNNLNAQKSSKNQLLADTQNDEKKYQSLLADAIAQLNALRNFSSSAGGSTCLAAVPGAGSDGYFYSQRDPRWCKQYIGNSKDTMGSVGCYITSIAMALKKIGSDISPSAYAANSDNFRFNTAYALNPGSPSGYHFIQTGYSSSTVDNELKNNRFVIAQIRMSGSISGMHFIVLISGSNGSYKMHDPWYGSDLDFSQHYTTGMIMSLRLFTK